MSDERLISKSKNKSGQEMPEKLFDLMCIVEEAYRMAGARAKHDYVYKDLMHYAVELCDSDQIEGMSKSE